MKLYTKTILLIILIAGGIGLCCSLMASRVMYNTLETELQEKAKIIVHLMAEHIVRIVIDKEAIPAKEALEKIISRNMGVDYAYVVGFDGEIFSHSFEGDFPKDLAKRVQKTIHIDKEQINKYSTSKGPILDVGYPLINGMSAYVHIGMNESQLHNQVVALRNRISILALSITLLGILLGTFMVRRITYPLSRLADSMHSVSKGETEEEIGFSGGGHEVEELTFAFNRMISERTRAEEALRESEVRFKDLASFLPLSVFETDDQGNVTYANHFALESIGYTHEDIDKGLHMLQVIHPKDHDRAIKMSIQVMEGEHTGGSEYFVQRKDGSTFPAFINTRASIKDDKPVGLKGYIFNLTEQKMAEEALRESEEKYRSIMEAMNDASYICSPDFRIEYMNPAMTKKIDRDAVGESCHKALHGLDEKCPWL